MTTTDWAASPLRSPNMQFGKVIFVFLIVGLSACATTEQTSPISRIYFEHELALNLSQEADGTLILELENLGSDLIEDRFPERMFEGYVMIVQEGTIPIKFYESKYFDYLIRATWFNPPVKLLENERIVYEIPLDSLRQIWDRMPDTRDDILAFAVLDHFNITSNTIRLEHGDRIGGRTRHGR